MLLSGRSQHTDVSYWETSDCNSSTMARLKYVLLFVCSVIVFSRLRLTEGIRIERGPTNATLNIGASTSLICDVTDQSVNKILWYHASTNVFISEGSHVYNNDELPKNYDVRVDEGVRTFNLHITNAEIGNTGWYECGYLNSNNIYKKLGNPAYVMVRSRHSPPEMLLSPPVCTVTQLPRLHGKEVDVDCSWTNGGQTVQPSIFYNGAPVEFNVTFANQIKSRILSPSQGVYGFVCGLLREDSTVAINSTCAVIYGRIARIRMDPLINDVYEGNVANFTCSIDGHGLNPIDLAITKDGKNLGKSTSVDTLSVQFTPALQDNNTLIECIASDLPGTMIKVESYLRILPAITTTIDTSTSTLTNTTTTNALTPTFASSMKTRTLYMIVIIVATLITILFCVLVVVGVCVRRKRRKVALLQATYTSEPSVEFVETTLILDDTDEQGVNKSTDDFSAYAVSPLSTSSTPARRSSLPDQIIHYQSLEDSIPTLGFRDRKQSEPFVVYAKPHEMNLRKWSSQGITTSTADEPSASVNEDDGISVTYAKPDKPKIRKWASQGAGAFEGNGRTDKKRDLFCRKSSQPWPLYAKPDKSTTSLHGQPRPEVLPHYAKPDKKKERRYVTQKVGKYSVSMHKTRKWMSMSKERVDINSFPKISPYSEVAGLPHSEEDDIIQIEESSNTSRESATKTSPDVPFTKSRSSPLYADPDDFTSTTSLRHGGYDKVEILQSSLISEVKERLSKSPHYESIPGEKDLTNGTTGEISSTDTIDESRTTSMYETEAEGMTDSNEFSIEDTYEILDKGSLDSLLTDDDDDFETVIDSESDTEMMVNPHYQMSTLKQIL